jgi:hypothetical protein
MVVTNTDFRKDIKSYFRVAINFETLIKVEKIQGLLLFHLKNIIH